MMCCVEWKIFDALRSDLYLVTAYKRDRKASEPLYPLPTTLFVQRFGTRNEWCYQVERSETGKSNVKGKGEDVELGKEKKRERMGEKECVFATRHERKNSVG